MNQVNEESKNSVFKMLAVVGFIAVIVFGVWLAVQIVSLMPSAFSSLASIADSVYNYDEEVELTITSQHSVVNSNNAFDITWKEIDQEGSYALSYACADGVSIHVRNVSGVIMPLACDEIFPLGDNISAIDVQIASERKRFVDVTYTIFFTPRNSNDPISASANVTVVNPAIPQSDTVADAQEETTEEDEEESEEADEETTESDEEVEEESPSTPVYRGPTEVVIETPTFSVPESDPNGFVDLTVRLVAVGHLSNSDVFTPRSNIDLDARGAIQFEVINLGTKESDDDWYFEAELPGGFEYESSEQASLHPQERVLFTLGFTGLGEEGIEVVEVSVHGGDDSVNTNNSFDWAISIVD